MPKTPMAQLPEKRPRWLRHRWSLVLGVVILGAATYWVRVASVRPVPSTATVPTAVEVARSRLELRSDRLHAIGSTEPFNGWMVEHYTDGMPRSRSAVTNGLLHGLSQGWYTNGQLQVSEHFAAGISHGVRSKWRPDGSKLSEVSIREGQLAGLFRQWHDNGALAEQVEFVGGRPHGLSRAYYRDGSLKAEVTMENGRVVTEKRWKEGELSARAPARSQPPGVSISRPAAELIMAASPAL